MKKRRLPTKDSKNPICRCGHRWSSHRDGAIVDLEIVCWKWTPKGGLCSCKGFTPRTYPRDPLQEMAEAWGRPTSISRPASGSSWTIDSSLESKNLSCVWGRWSVYGVV